MKRPLTLMLTPAAMAALPEPAFAIT